VAAELHRFGIMFQGVAANFEHYMTLLSARQKLVASNLANADTPGYRTEDIDFHTEFEHAMSGQNPTVIEPDGLEVKPDGNNVDLDREARLLSENTMRFAVASNLARAELSSLKAAIQEGK
jgi:flagellar basal-body rod protein FlgB